MGADAGGVASTVIARADKQALNSLQDLRGHNVLAVAPDAFGGFQVAWGEFKRIGLDPHRDFSALSFSGFWAQTIGISETIWNQWLALISRMSWSCQSFQKLLKRSGASWV